MIGVRGTPERDIESLGGRDGMGAGGGQEILPPPSSPSSPTRPRARLGQVDSRRAERAPLRTGVIVSSDDYSKLR